MLIDREVDYAIRLIRALTDGEIHPTRPLCEEEEIPWSFAYKILRKLKTAGFVRIVAGSHGGAQLLRSPDDISLYDLIQAVDEDRSLISDCMESGYECSWSRKKCRACTVHQHLRSFQKGLDGRLKEISIGTLLEPERSEAQGISPLPETQATRQ